MKAKRGTKKMPKKWVRVEKAALTCAIIPATNDGGFYDRPQCSREESSSHAQT